MLGPSVRIYDGWFFAILLRASQIHIFNVLGVGSSTSGRLACLLPCTSILFLVNCNNLALACNYEGDSSRTLLKAVTFLGGGFFVTRRILHCCCFPTRVLALFSLWFPLRTLLLDTTWAYRYRTKTSADSIIGRVQQLFDLVDRAFRLHLAYH